MSTRYNQAKEKLCALLAPIFQKQGGKGHVINELLNDNYYHDLVALKSLAEKMEFAVLRHRFMDEPTRISIDAYFDDIENLYLDQEDFNDLRSGGIASLLRRQLGLDQNDY